MQKYNKIVCLLLIPVFLSGCFGTNTPSDISTGSNNLHHEASYSQEDTFLHSLPVDSYFLGYNNTTGFNKHVEKYVEGILEFMKENGFDEKEFPQEEQDKMKSYLQTVEKISFLISVVGNDLKSANLPEPLEKVGMLASLSDEQSKDIADFFIDQLCIAGFVELQDTPDNIEIIDSMLNEKILESINDSTPFEDNSFLSMKDFNIEIKTVSKNAIYFEALNCGNDIENIIAQSLPSETIFVTANTFSFYKYAKNFPQWQEQISSYKKIGFEFMKIGAAQIPSEIDKVTIASMLIEGLESQISGLNNIQIGMDTKRSGLFWKIEEDAFFMTTIISLFSGEKKQILSNYYNAKGLSAQYSLHKDINYSYNISEKNNTLYFQHRYGNIDSFFFVRRIFLKYFEMYGEIFPIVIPALLGVSIVAFIETINSDVTQFNSDEFESIDINNSGEIE